MTPDLQQLVTALREELKHYGEMLALLEQQQQSVSSRAADQTFAATAAVQRQAEVIVAARRCTETRRHALARELRQDEDATIPQLMPLLPPQYRPLLQTLVEENNTLFKSVQRAARENHQLLSRSAESMQRFLELLFPGTEPVAA
jgi:flagellar biosynthesis/type III secretory pathway chaperone